MQRKTEGTKIDSVVSCFKEGFNCSQAILLVYGEQFALSREDALKVSWVFGVGTDMGETCGAVTGTFMLIGAKYGRTEVEH